MENYRQLIKETMKQEWEVEFPNKEDSALNFDESIFYHTFGELAERICVKVWNKALDLAADNAEADANIVSTDTGDYSEIYVLKNSILKFKL